MKTKHKKIIRKYLKKEIKLLKGMLESYTAINTETNIIPIDGIKSNIGLLCNLRKYLKEILYIKNPRKPFSKHAS